MGDRGNIVIETDGDHFTAPIFMYTHWSGSEIRETLKEALVKGKDRWDDPSYLARVIFQTLVGGDDGVTGYGLSTVLCDNEHPLLCVNMDKQRVILRGHSLESEIKAEWTFPEFISE